MEKILVRPLYFFKIQLVAKVVPYRLSLVKDNECSLHPLVKTILDHGSQTSSHCLELIYFFRNVETWPQCKFLKVYCPQFSIKIRLLHSYLAGDLLNSTNFVLLLLVNEMGTPRIPKLNAIIPCIDMHKKLVFSNSNRLWIKALQLSLHNISLKN